jgi:hypothetical protein
LFNDRWKGLSRPDTRGSRGALPSGRPVMDPAPRKPAVDAGQMRSYSRHSNGLEQFFGHIQGEPALRLLDLSGASQANVAFITNLGHRLYSEDFLRSLDLAFADGDFYENQADPRRAEAFLDQNLSFPDNHFDGALLWDVLEFLAPPLLKAAVERLSRVVKPGSYLLAIFHADERAGAVPIYSYRIADGGTLVLSPHGMRQPAQFFNNRAVERIFPLFESVKFFLTRDALREVIVKR